MVRNKAMCCLGAVIFERLQIYDVIITSSAALNIYLYIGRIPQTFTTITLWIYALIWEM